MSSAPKDSVPQARSWGKGLQRKIMRFASLLNRFYPSASWPGGPTESSVASRAPLGAPAPAPTRDKLPLVAYQTRDDDTLPLRPASHSRNWMNETIAGFANRCLPLRIANQAGWFILAHELVEVVWDGSMGVNGLLLTKGTMDDKFLSSHFGHGILTWRIPYLFRTPPGYNLYVRGPANCYKDGAFALDGIVETDWAVSTFTMNWKIVRTGVPIRFEQGEPICMIFPIARGDLERFHPEIRPIASEPELEAGFNDWKRSREEFNERTHHLAGTGHWQRHYYLGQTTRDEAFAGHQVGLKLREFVKRK